jgi:putative ABC transport system permease protein
MFKNYLKITLRNIKRHKGYSFINIAGLAIGMAICILILLFVRDELSYDTHHIYKDRIYRIERQWFAADGSVRGSLSSLAPGFIPFLKQEFPEMEHIVRLLGSGDILISTVDNNFVEERFFYAEHDIFEVFTIPLINGNPKTALKNPNSLVLSESMVQKYFGDEDPMGKVMKVGSEREDYQVTGVMKDGPKNSHVHFDFFTSYVTLKGRFPYYKDGSDYFFGTTNLTDNVTYVYMRLAKDKDPEEIAARIPGFLDRHLPSYETDSGDIFYPRQWNNLILRKVTDIHLHSHNSTELEPNSDIRYVALFTLIAVFILIIACINFMNLSTARAAKRAREVGLRKVVGANRRLLTTQFLGESLIITFLATMIALVIVAVLLPYFSAFSGHELKISLLLNPVGLLLLMGVFLVTGLAAGLYPAFYLSAYKPATILRGELTRGTRGAILRKVMVVFQFAISVVLIISVAVVFKQMRFLQDANLGFQHENIVLIPADQPIQQNWWEIKQELLNSPRIVTATLSKRAPSGRLLDAPGFSIEINGEVVQDPFTMPHNRVEHDFFKTYGMKIVAGRDFSIEHPTDKDEAFILNETAVRRLGFKSPEDALGKPVYTVAPNLSGRVIGVVADFNYESLHHEIVPMLTYIQLTAINTVSLRIAPGNIQETMAHVQGVWDRFHPGYPISYTFLDDRLNELYRNEARMMEMFGYFSLLAILIACLGLFGLSSFTTEARTKEIGIRKILGASLSNIVTLLSREYTKWVLMANIIACPVAYFAMDRWLNNFAYRVSIGWTIFILTALVTFMIALLTVSYQSIKAALGDPAEALRYE